MIPLSPAALETPDPTESWQRQLAAAVSDPAELLGLLDLQPQDLDGAPLADATFPLRVPRYFVGLMQRGDPDDPLLRQVLPSAREREPAPGFVADPVGDLAASHGAGVLHKYHGRALLVTTGACAVHCRYCFRRHFPYAEHNASRDWQQVVETLHDLTDVSELILSGGDPLSLSDRRLGDLLRNAERIPHLRRLRLHTRLPVVLPARITPRLVELLGASRLQVVVVIHANHPQEVSPALGTALAALRGCCEALLNQSVLLKSVNDDADTLRRLSEALIGIGVLPYYLHLLDPVAGAAHFDVPAARAHQLVAALRETLPGYLVPRLVRELPGRASKTPLA